RHSLAIKIKTSSRRLVEIIDVEPDRLIVGFERAEVFTVNVANNADFICRKRIGILPRIQHPRQHVAGEEMECAAEKPKWTGGYSRDLATQKLRIPPKEATIEVDDELYRVARHSVRPL